MIFVTLGTMHMDFGRLVRKMDEIAQRIGEPVIMQTGLSTTLPKYAQHFTFKSRDEIAVLIDDAKVVVTHAGIGSVMDVMRAERPLVVVPRLRRYGEHNNDHQLDLAQMVERRSWGRMVLDVTELDAICTSPPPERVGYQPASAPLVAAIRDLIHGASSATKRFDIVTSLRR